MTENPHMEQPTDSKVNADPGTDSDPGAANLSAAIPSPRRHRPLWRSVLIWLAVMVLGAALLAGLSMSLLAHGVSPNDLNNVARKLHNFRVWGLAWQVVAAALVVWRWPAIVRWANRRGYVPEREVDLVIALRPKVAGFLALYLILVPIGPMTLIHSLR